MKARACCSHDCDQGRRCPHRHAAPPTRREWLLTLALLALALGLSLLGGAP